MHDGVVRERQGDARQAIAVGTLKDPTFIPASTALVRRDWKYIHWPEHQVEQLFDLADDPREEHDLAKDPAHAERLAALRARHRELQAVVR